MMSDTDSSSYADNNTLHVSANTIDEVIKMLELPPLNCSNGF